MKWQVVPSTWLIATAGTVDDDDVDDDEHDDKALNIPTLNLYEDGRTSA